MEELDFKELIKFFWTKKFLIIFGVILFIVLEVLYTKVLVTPIYEATTSLILVETEFENEAEVTAYSKLVDRYSVIINSKKVANKVIENLKLNMQTDELKNLITIDKFATSYCIKINVSNVNPENAVKIANEIAKVSAEEISGIYKDNKIQVLDVAVVNSTPINANLLENVLKFELVGLVLIFGSLILRFMFCDTIKIKELDEKNN